MGVHGTQANWSAVLWAAQEAQRSRSPLVLVGCGSAEPRDQIRDMLGDARDRLASQVDDIHQHVEVGEPSEALARMSDEDDLVVVGNRHHRPSQSVLDSTSIALATRSSGPVVIVPDSWSVHEHHADLVVAGVAAVAADNDRQVLDFGFSRASELDVAPAVVCSSGDQSAMTEPAAGDLGLDSPSVQLDKRLEESRQRYPNVLVSTRYSPLAPAVALLGDATSAQLLLVGRQHTGPGLSDDLGLDATTLLVLQSASCPVAVLPAPQST